MECHEYAPSLPFFIDSKFHNTGIFAKEQKFDELDRRAREIIVSVSDAGEPGPLAHRPEFSELGRFLVTRQSRDVGAFKTPTLRDIELTWPYMHNGSIRTLLDVVKFYNRGGGNNPNLDVKVRPLNLTEDEMSDIVEFMRALTSDDVLREAQSSKPQSRISASVRP